MIKNQLSWMIGGPQGSGINASAEVFAKACSRAGLHVFANIEYHSNIMGKHSYYRVRVAEHEVRSPVDEAHILVALDDETLFGDADHMRYPSHSGHLGEVSPGGGVIYDASIALDHQKAGRTDIRLYPIPYLDIIKKALEEIGKGEQARRYDIMKNIVGLGASLALSEFPFDRVADVIREGFKGKRAEVGELNVRAARLAYEHIKSNFPDDFPFKLQPHSRPVQRILARGSYVHAIAKLKAGCNLQTYYPISPATDESVYLEKHQRAYGLLVQQCEDEISSINMAVGAAHMGARSSTSTSGPGFTLMVEGIGFASITEAPGPVLLLYQRGGPSTGLPTRQEQADLLFALHPTHGDFVHIVTAAGDMEECYQHTMLAFNWAERYQMPVIVLTDKHLAASFWTLDRLGNEFIKIDRGLIFEDGAKSNGDKAAYLRYALTESGISPRSRPGTSGGQFWATSDEHNPDGHITEGVDMRVTMVEKRFRKLELAAREIPLEVALGSYGPADAELTVVGWGSTKGAILDAMDRLGEEGLAVNYVQVRLMRPFPAAALTERLGKAKRIVLVENNYSGQLGLLIREQTGIHITDRILKFDGRPFSEDELVTALREVRERGGTKMVKTRVPESRVPVGSPA
jgi:2-oxoglutarate ferredoxin oxidoreductase subunit alpha